jgi:Uma2 family endonuclease
MSAVPALMEIEECVLPRVVRDDGRAISFEQYLDLVSDRYAELVEGVMVDKMAAQYDHENLFGWLFGILRPYVHKRSLGIVLGSRTPMQVSGFGGRLPDLLFVQQDRAHIVSQKAIYGAPDLIIEIRSPSDRGADFAGLEADYRNAGVQEIVFIDLQRQQIHVLRKRGEDYSDETFIEGTLKLETLGGIELPVSAILQEPRPDEYDMTTQLLERY